MIFFDSCPTFRIILVWSRTLLPWNPRAGPRERRLSFEVNYAPGATPTSMAHGAGWRRGGRGFAVLWGSSSEFASADRRCAHAIKSRGGIRRLTDTSALPPRHPPRVLHWKAPNVERRIMQAATIRWDFPRGHADE